RRLPLSKLNRLKNAPHGAVIGFRFPGATAGRPRPTRCTRSVFMTKDKEEDQYNELLEMDLIGKVSNAYKVQIDGYDKHNLLHHDVIELPNGNLLATSHEPDSEYVQDQMNEIDRETGKTVQEINAKD